MAGAFINQRRYFGQRTAARFQIVGPSRQLLRNGIDVADPAISIGGDYRIAQAIKCGLKTLATVGKLPALFFLGAQVALVHVGQLLQLAARESEQQYGNDD